MKSILTLVLLFYAVSAHAVFHRQHHVFVQHHSDLQLDPVPGINPYNAVLGYSYNFENYAIGINTGVHTEVSNANNNSLFLNRLNSNIAFGVHGQWYFKHWAIGSRVWFWNGKGAIMPYIDTHIPNLNIPLNSNDFMMYLALGIGYPFFSFNWRPAFVANNVVFNRVTVRINIGTYF